MLNSDQPVTSNSDSSDAHENEIEYEIANGSPNDVNDAAQQRIERLNDDVSKRNEASETVRNENSDWPNPTAYPKIQEKSSPDLSERQKHDANLSEENSFNENDAKDSPKRERYYRARNIAK